MKRPWIAVLLDENTSADATRYEAAKGYFRAVRDAGGLPFGVPYLPEVVEAVVAEFDGFLAVGGRIAYPDAWYVAGEVSPFPASERFAVERALMQGFLARDRPVLGICAGMQMLAGLGGCRLTADVAARTGGALAHDRPGELHPVTPLACTRLAQIVGEATLTVNTRHREAVWEVAPGVTVSARAPDGVVEAIELPAQRFALGLQWHQEAFAGTEHPGNAVFAAFVAACA